MTQRVHDASAGVGVGVASESIAIEENVHAIRAWEERVLRSRTRVERLSDWMTSQVARGPVLVAHIVFFVAWAAINLGAVPAIAPFDPFPSPLLTLTVSIEAIFLALFVLGSQNRLTRHSDARAHLDLQIDLLAEREMTVVLRLLQDIAAHLQCRTTLTADQIRDLAAFTDLERLTERVQKLEER